MLEAAEVRPSPEFRNPEPDPNPGPTQPLLRVFSSGISASFTPFPPNPNPVGRWTQGPFIPMSLDCLSPRAALGPRHQMDWTLKGRLPGR
jgi:hypothetical protein